MDKYCDTSKVVILPTTKEVVYKMITKKHYAKKWTASTNIYGVYWDEGDSPFFDDRKLKLIGAVLYGHPSGFRVVKSVSEDLEIGEVLELKRLWIEDGYGNNIESYCIAQTLKMLKKDSPQTKVVISYADPTEKHKGIIYRASNWYYQGRDIGLAGGCKSYMYRYPGTDKWLSDRAIGGKLGSNGLEYVLSKIPDMEYKKKEVKHRYIYFLCNKGEKKRLIKQLKHPLVKYD